MSLRTLVVATLLAACVWGGPAPRAGASPLTDYLHARRALHRPVLSAPLLAAAQQDPQDYLGQVFEVAAEVGGLVDADGARTVLLSAPGGASLSARLPDSLRGASWIDSGARVRVLLLAEKTGNDLALSNVRVLAVAPEDDVTEAERAAAAAAVRPRRSYYPSRSLSYANSRRAEEPVAGAGARAAVYGPGGGHPIAPLSARALAIYGPYRDAIRRMNRRLSEYDVDKITTSVLYFSDRYNIDPRLVVAMIIAESDFDTGAVSRTGAMGLGQLMPETARGLGVTNAFDPVQNIAASVHILRGNLDKYGGAPADAGVIPFDRIALTMAAYNAGSGAVRKYHGVPPYRETRRYVARVAALYRRMCGLSG